MANEKLITLDNLRRFKQQLDQHGGGGPSGDAPRVFVVAELELIELPSELLSQVKAGDVIVEYGTLVGTVTYRDEIDMTIVAIDNSYVTYYYYTFADEEWTYSNMARYNLSEMGGGDAIYVHNIGITPSGSGGGASNFLSITTKSPTPFTFATLWQWLNDNHFDSIDHALQIMCGYDVSMGSLFTRIAGIVDTMTDSHIIYCYYEGATAQIPSGNQYDIDSTSAEFTDMVYEVK